MVHHHRDVLAGHSAAHREKASGMEVAVLGERLHVRHELYIAHGENTRIVEQRAIDAAAVGPFVMAILISSVCQWLPGREVVENFRVLNLAHSYYRATYGFGQHVGPHVGKHTGKVVELAGILASVPLICPFWKKIVVAFSLVMTSVEKVFKIIESYRIYGEFPLLSLRSATDNDEQKRQ